MKTKSLTISCPACEGSGRVPLPHQLGEVLALVRVNKELTAPEVYAELFTAEFSPTAANNRLDQLVQLGFLKRRRAGKVWKYSLTP